MTLHWTQAATDGAARAGTLHTAHGEVPTPVFMPVGTYGTVKAMTADAVRSTGARMVLLASGTPADQRGAGAVRGAIGDLVTRQAPCDVLLLRGV